MAALPFYNEELKVLWSLKGIKTWWRHHFKIPRTDQRYLDATEVEIFEDYWDWKLLNSDQQPNFDKESLEEWVLGAEDLVTITEDTKAEPDE